MIAAAAFLVAVPLWALALAGLVPVVVLGRMTARVCAGLDRVPLHFNARLEPDGWGPPWMAVAVAPVLQLGIAGLLLFIAGAHLPTRGGDPRVVLALAMVMAGAASSFTQGVFFVMLRRWRRGG